VTSRVRAGLRRLTTTCNVPDSPSTRRPHTAAPCAHAAPRFTCAVWLRPEAAFLRTPHRPTQEPLISAGYLEGHRRSNDGVVSDRRGTGKPILPSLWRFRVACQSAWRIILARPASEAGDALGFLPGTLQDKIDPYAPSTTLSMTMHRPRKGPIVPRRRTSREIAPSLHAAGAR